jgi:hypothetical protein
MSKYTIDHFIDKFGNIPSSQWCIRSVTQITPFGEAHCALGHCETSIEAGALVDIFNLNGLSVASINDGMNTNGRWGDTPKARIMSALRYLKNDSN